MPLRFLLIILSLLLSLSCSRRDPRPTVTLFASCDAFIAQPILKQFEDSTGIKVNMVGDTEATKTTGLIERLIADKSKPTCDVWWSNELLGSAQLASLGLLEAFTPAAAKTDFAGAWPTAYADSQQRWYGHALRWRVIAFNTNRIKPADAPRTLAALADPKFKSVGMARPQFGTTRSQIAAIVAARGEVAARDWLKQLVANGLHLYDGNSAVVQALAHGEIEIGLTDTDDALEGKAKKWPVDFIPDTDGPLAIPNTVALIRGRPHPKEAQQLADFLLSAAAEEALARSDGHNLPIRSTLRAALHSIEAPAFFASVSPDQMVKALASADKLINEVLGR